MQSKFLNPSPKYLVKMRVVMSIVALLIAASAFLLGMIISLDNRGGLGGLAIVFLVSSALALLWWVPAMLLSGPYFRSLSYEIQDDEVIVNAGVITQSVKHVPYRTVTNLTIKRDLLDRWFFGLGTLNIQTAGMSGQTGAEESLVGLPNVQEVYESVVTELRRFRGGMAPTATEVEEAPIVPQNELMSAILAEVRSIRQSLEDETN